mgnify:CR=1 FL=1
MQIIDLSELSMIEESTLQSGNTIEGGLICGFGCGGLICGIGCGFM